ncbi:TraR/DksA family transcriptional regulator [Ramlibacter terrae]|uniref:TraR/DksA family transcriptional regulator n=1 Tax=Ramlibacter terrae TaxID=2732511 RepID=A0ABX6P6B4_9BURK|nr:TraR/DksA family transcriptional regulator [Ramlibacter terrae]
MPLPATTSPLRSPAARLLARRAELRVLIDTAAAVAAGVGEQGSGVFDLKDVAAEDSRARIANAALTRAAGELAQVNAALLRVHEGSYGVCDACGDDIDERRLAAVPTARFCTGCRAVHERLATASRRTTGLRVAG